jgi:predicted polyphosphate/ATP-dependent NAD kinase
MSVSVGIVANPASGRDIRRLVAGASVFGNADKAGMVLRLLAGLGAAGVRRALMMPASDGLSLTLERQLGAFAVGSAAPLPALEVLPMRLTGTARDSVAAVEAMRSAGVAAIVVLGGDGTHRVVASCCGDVPLCALSTGTNNVFPEMRETTVAGLATGLVAAGDVPAGEALRREAALAVRVGTRNELALVDVAVSPERFIGARALWRPEVLTELLVAFAHPNAVGLSAIAGLLAPTARGAGSGLHVRLAPLEDAALVLRVALAPGLVAPVGVADFAPIAPGEEIVLAPAAGCLALDGERELERDGHEPAHVALREGPLTIDVDAAMAFAAREGLLRHQNAI